MWTGTVQSIDNDKGVLLIGVFYTNGTDSFTESLDMSGSTQDALTQRIQNKLVLLNANDDLVASLAQPILDKSIVLQAPTPLETVSSVATSTVASL